MTALHRRQLLQGLAGAAGLGALARTPLVGAAPRDRDRIRVENEREGTADWQLTYTRIDPKTKCTRFGGGLGGRPHLDYAVHAPGARKPVPQRALS